MKHFTVQAVVALLFLMSPWRLLAQPAPFVERQDLALTLAPENHLLIGESTTLFAPGTNQLFFRLAPTAEITKVAVEGKEVSYSFREGLLSLSLASPGRHSVTISYKAVFDDRVANQPNSSEDPTYGVSAAITPRGTFLGSGSGWYPEPQSVPKLRTVRIEAPTGVEGITNGKRVARQDVGSVTRSIWEEANPVGELSLSAGRYLVEEKNQDGIPIYTYFTKENASLAQGYLEAAARHLRFYVDLFGPYPFEKFAVVENFFPTGYGLPSYTLLGSTIIRLPFIVETSLPHEIAHSWWGNSVEVDYRTGNWCEGLVTYLADYLLKEKRSAGEAEQYRRQILADFSQLVHPEYDFPLVKFTGRVDPASRAIGYGKAAMLFHMVRTRIGDRAFFEALRDVARTRMYQTASWSDFVAAFSSRAKTDLRPFMDPWLTRTGGPRLSLSGVTTTHRGEKWQVTGSVLQNPSYPDLDVSLKLETEREQVTELIKANGEETSFLVTAKALPTRLSLDPGADLFRILDPEEIPVTVNSIKGSRRVVGVQTANCPISTEAFRFFLGSLDQRNAKVVTEEELNPAVVQDNDLVFCAPPKNISLLGPLPSEATIAPDRFSIEGKSFSGPDSLFFLVLKRPLQDRISALFHPLSGEAADKYAYKITHYGKYGYLVFSEGGNRLKGGTRPPAGASTVELSTVGGK